jgi:diguanylate cyclase (GGDEF)-like protein
MESPVEASSLRKLVRLTGAIVALVTAVSGPFGYAVSAYIDPGTDFRFATFGLISLVGAGLGPLAYLAFRTLPMRMLHRALNATHRINEELRHLAHHDPLTRLPNRVLFRQELEQALSAPEPFALLLLDLDRFKTVNDTLGHAVGDALLTSVALRLRGLVRKQDTVIRLGGDEFAVIQRSAATPAVAEDLAKRIISLLSRPYDLPGHQIEIGTSVGIAVAPTDSRDSAGLFQCADMALYRAKENGRGTFHTFERSMAEAVQARHELERDLQKAIAEHQFEVYYQPLVNLHLKQVTGFEALLRWRHPTRGFIPPCDFIPLAEETGLILPLGSWVLGQACEMAAWWPESIKVSVNLSAVQFRSDLVGEVVRTLQRTGLAPGRLELEITESVLLQDTDQTLATLHQLHAHGVRFSLDDFGTGYSSLSYLRRFPFDKLKIDASFVKDLPSEESLAIIKAVTGLAKSLHITATAEGVETLEQLETLRAEGCDEVQGYFFSEAKAALELPRLILEIKRQYGVETLQTLRVVN